MDSAEALADFFAAAADRLEAGTLHAERVSAIELQLAAERHSQGTATPEELAAEDHPYARRHGQPQRDPREVNRQTGEFAAAWLFDAPRFEGDDVVGAVYNADPKAAAFLAPGTRFMFARHPEELAEAETEASRADRLERVVEEAFDAGAD